MWLEELTEGNSLHFIAQAKTSSHGEEKKSAQCILSQTVSSTATSSALVFKSPGDFLNLDQVLALLRHSM